MHFFENLERCREDDVVFFLSRFSSQTLMIDRTPGEGRGPSSVALYHFHPLTNIKTFICNFASEMTITDF